MKKVFVIFLSFVILFNIESYGQVVEKKCKTCGKTFEICTFHGIHKTIPVEPSNTSKPKHAGDKNLLIKAKDYYLKERYERASSLLSKMNKWNADAYELAGDICYFWNADLWDVYYKKACEMGSSSARKKMQRNIRLNAVSVGKNTVQFVYSSQDVISNSEIKSVDDVKNIQTKATAGDIYAQYNLGRMYEYGDWVEQDYSQAAYWYNISGENRHVMSAINLAWLYSEGKGVEKDESKAFNLYMSSVDKKGWGVDVAIHNLGLCYQYGKGVPVDKEKAVKMYRKNMERTYNPFGIIESVAEYYELVYHQYIQDNQALSENASYWLYKYLHLASGNHDVEIDQIIERAERSGVQSANIQADFGSYYIYYRKSKNYEEGLKWLRAASKQNHRRAIRDIGVCYEEGYGVKKNLTEAKKCYLKAKELGYSAEYDLERLAKKGY